MGYRFRRSINLGKHFRINISNKGIGYSYGVKGFRVSHGADGKVRQTTSIPGTGIYNTKVISSAKPGRRTPEQTHNSQTAPRFPFGRLIVMMISVGLFALSFWLLSIGGLSDVAFLFVCFFMITVGAVMFVKSIVQLYRYFVIRSAYSVVSSDPAEMIAGEKEKEQD